MTTSTDRKPPTAAAQPTASPDAHAKPTALSRPLVITGMILATALSALDTTIVGTAMPTIVGVLQGLPLYPLVIAAYLLTATTTVPVYGKLADMYGRKPVFMFGAVTFVLGSLLCGLAWDMWSLIAFRAVQGLGAGSVLPVSLTLIGDLFEREERARLQGVFGSVWGISSMVGPVVGGGIVQLFDWRWVFFINVPIGIVSALLLWLYLREPPVHTRQRVDIAGAVTLTLSVGLALVALQMGGSGAALQAALWAGAAGLMAAFIFFERRAPAPVLSLSVLGRPVILVACLAGLFSGGVVIGYAAYLPLLAQGAWGGMPVEAGLVVAPLSIGWPIASAASGRLMRNFPYYRIVIAGLVIMVVGCAMLLLVQLPAIAGSGLFRTLWVLLSSFITGVGLGTSTTTMLIAVQSSVPWGERGVATASVQFFRNMGNTLAAAVLGVILTASLAPVLATPRMQSFTASIPAELRANDDPSLGPANVLLDPETRSLIPPDTVEALSGALADSLFWVYAGILAMAVLGLVVAVRFPRKVEERER